MQDSGKGGVLVMGKEKWMGRGVTRGRGTYP